MNPTQQVLDPVTEADTPTNVYRLPATDALVALHTAARDRTASQADFIRAAARLIAHRGPVVARLFRVGPSPERWPGPSGPGPVSAAR